eukprot:Hpha_TRINITY_DN35654_c0_g1::TRINITY_DN35654_c0_g1_i1::g.68665::m.68665
MAEGGAETSNGAAGVGVRLNVGGSIYHTRRHSTKTTTPGSVALGEGAGAAGSYLRPPSSTGESFAGPSGGGGLQGGGPGAPLASIGRHRSTSMLNSGSARASSAMLIARGVENIPRRQRSEALVGLAAQHIPGLDLNLRPEIEVVSLPSARQHTITSDGGNPPLGSGSPLGSMATLNQHQPSALASSFEAPIWQMTSLVQSVKQLAFFRFAVLWIVFVSLVIGFFVWVAEGGDVAFIDALFIATNAVTCTGLSTFDLTKASKTSAALVGVAMQLGSSTMLSLVPVAARVFYLRRILPEQSGGKSYDLRLYRRVPQTVVEYKALVILLRLVLLYQLVVYVLFGGLILIYLAAHSGAHHTATSGSGGGILAWSVFHTISAYNNAGFSTMPDSMGSFVVHPFLLFCIMMLVLAGNVLLPVFLRWTVVLLNAVSPKDSSRKIWFRYLLLNGRSLYTGIFGSQQTWVLLVTQTMLIAYQIIVTLSVSWDDPAFSAFTSGQKITVAWFEAINTRHAGMTTISLGLDPGDPRGRVSPATIVTYLMMMFLAPVPFLAVLHSTMPKQTAEAMRRRLRGTKQPSPLAASRDLSLQLAATQLADYVEGRRESAVPSEDAPEMLYYIDCRALLMTRYPDERVPYSERIAVRAKAVRYHLGLLCKQFTQGRIFRDLSFLWFAWFLIASFQGRSEQGIEKQLFILFELVTAFGNVGLSLGSTKVGAKDYCGYCAFSSDLGTAGKLIVMLVEILGRTREMPQRIDGALQLGAEPDEDKMMNDRYRSRGHPEPRRPSLAVGLLQRFFFGSTEEEIYVPSDEEEEPLMRSTRSDEEPAAFGTPGVGLGTPSSPLRQAPDPAEGEEAEPPLPVPSLTRVQLAS